MTTVSIRLWQPAGWTREGHLFVKPEDLEWQQLNYLRPDQCDHQESICRTCLEIWELDWEIDLDTIEDLDAEAGEAEPDVREPWIGDDGFDFDIGCGHYGDRDDQ